MRIGILGAGKVGGTLGKQWAAKGHQVMFGVRDTNAPKVQSLLDEAGPNTQAGSVAQAAAFGEVVLLSAHWPNAREALQQAGDLSGKILIDAVNPMIPASPGDAPSAAEDVASWTARAKLVKAFNTTSSANMANPHYGNYRIDTFIYGDDEPAKAVVMKLAQEIDFDVIDAGPLASAALLESLAKLLVNLACQRSVGPTIAFKLLKR